jgi:predicted nuclease of predicted toxin-antitoxin system
MIKFLTDENIATSLVKAIRKKGCDVKDIKEEKLFGIEDNEIIKIANKENRIILTHDKDFANLLNFPLTSHKGVILLRFVNQSPSNSINHFIPLLDSKLRDKFKNRLTIISEDFVKIG